jgi:hypothetical protein
MCRESGIQPAADGGFENFIIYVCINIVESIERFFLA